MAYRMSWPARSVTYVISFSDSPSMAKARTGQIFDTTLSVLEDARRDVSPEIEWAMIDRYVGAISQPEAFEQRAAADDV